MTSPDFLTQSQNASPFFNRTARAVFGVSVINENKAITKVYSGVFNGRIKFKIEKVSDSHANKMTVQFFNVNPSTLAILQQQGGFVEVQAGYGGNYPIIGVGNIYMCTQSIQNPDIITTVECYDGGYAIENAVVTPTSFAKGTLNSQIIKTCLNLLTKYFAIDLSNVQYPPDFQIQKSVTIRGQVRNILDTYITNNPNFNYTWGILDGAIHIIPKQGTSVQFGYVLSPQTGLIDIPSKNTQGPLGNVNGTAYYKLKSLLNGLLNPYNYVQVKSIYVPQGFYEMERILHDGDNYEGNYHTEIEARALGTG